MSVPPAPVPSCGAYEHGANLLTIKNHKPMVEWLGRTSVERNALSKAHSPRAKMKMKTKNSFGIYRLLSPEVWGKVMFLHLSVILFTVRGCPCPGGSLFRGSLSRTHRTVKSGRYASYSNASLFFYRFASCFAVAPIFVWCE